MTKKKVIKILRIVMPLVAVISAIIFVPWILIWAWILPLPDTVQDQVDQGMNYDYDGMIVYVDEGGKEPQWFTAGWHDRDAKISAKPDAYFKIGSVQKLYLAVAIAKLANKGKLDLSKTVADYFPEYKDHIENASEITVKMMIQHRSGIPNMTDIPHYWENPPTTNKGKIALILDQPALFKPGAKFSYCNTNYVLLRELVSKVVGYHYNQYIKEAVLLPYGLNHTFASMHDINMDNLMSGYYVGIEEDIKSADYDIMVATAQDLGNFIRKLNDGSLFEPGEQKIYTDIYRYDHTGLVPGYQTIAKYHKDIDTVVIQFVNTTNFSGWTWSTSEIVYNRIVKILEQENN